jgi:hypothetical protein
VIVLFVKLSDADPMLNLLRQHGYINVTQQIDAQITVERLLPDDVIPTLTVKYGDVGFDVYGQQRADALWDAMRVADRQIAS